MADDKFLSSKFSFNSLPNKQFPSLDGKTLQESLTKWSMYGRLTAQAFSYDQFFQSYQAQDFVLAFMRDRNVTSTLKVLSDSGRSSVIGIEADTVTVEMVPCTCISMSFFDRLYNDKIVRGSGHIVKCLDECLDDLVISDELRKMLLIEDSDHYELFSDAERNDFLFLLFKHLCIGGTVCQYEDTIEPYLEAAKAIYKDLISVQKNKEGELIITSLVFRITASESGSVYYPSDTPHVQNFTYLIVDPIKRHVNVLHHRYGACLM